MAYACNSENQKYSKIHKQTGNTATQHIESFVIRPNANRKSTPSFFVDLYMMGQFVRLIYHAGGGGEVGLKPVKSFFLLFLC